MLCKSTIVYLLLGLIGFLLTMKTQTNKAYSILSMILFAALIQFVCTRVSPLFSWILVVLAPVISFVGAVMIHKG